MEDKLYYYKGRVVKVIDGDTIDVIVDLGMKMTTIQRLRLMEVDTPERSELNFKEATQFTRERVNEQEVIIHTEKSDVFGRYLVEVYYKDEDTYKCLNDELKVSGLLKPDSKWNT